LEDIGVDEEIILKLILSIMGIRVLGLLGLIEGPVAGTYECGSKPLASIK
jgi:hypothetical protein